MSEPVVVNGYQWVPDNRYERGVADERKRHELKMWHEMPDVDDWFWVQAEFDMDEGPCVEEYIAFMSDEKRAELDAESEQDDFLWWVFLGPIPNPFDEQKGGDQLGLTTPAG